MSQAIVDPQQVRRFASELKAFNDSLRDQMSRLHGQFQQLGETWRDQEHARFAQVFQETIQALRRFLQASQEHHPFLIRKAEAAEEYLRRR